jgi:hypothetical protein
VVTVLRMSAQMEAIGVPLLTPTHVFEMLEGGRSTTALGPLAGTALLAVDVDDGRAHSVATALRNLPCVVVGVGSLPRTLANPPDVDILLTDVRTAPRPWRTCPEGIDRALSNLSLSVMCAPRAATTLVQVLRLGRDLTFADALVAESHAYSVLQSGSEFRAWLDNRGVTKLRAKAKDAVEVVRADGTLTVRLRRPRVNNALDAASSEALAKAFEVAADDTDVERIHLRGEGPDFCGGADLDELSKAPDPLTGHLVRVTRSPARALERCAARTTAHVHGACVGAGVELAALAGRVVASSDTTFQLPEVRMGLIPGCGGTASIPRRIGRQRTAWLAVSGTTIDVGTARDWGLVDVG